MIERAERNREHALVARLKQAPGTGGAAGAGLNEVLSMLEQNRVEALLVPLASLTSAENSGVVKLRSGLVIAHGTTRNTSVHSRTVCSGPP